eukprot:2981663-Pyramimonas_sp.AAC.1
MIVILTRISLTKDPTISSCAYRILGPSFYEALGEGCAEMGRGRQANPAIGAFCGASCEATNRVR